MAVITETERQLLQLLACHFQKSAAAREAFAEAEEIQWSGLLEEAKRQAVFPIVFAEARHLLDKETHDRFERGYYQALYNNVRVRRAQDALHALLTEAGIPYVIMKGSASAAYYPNPLLRTAGDIDFLVDEKDRDRCGRMLVSAGYQGERENDWGIDRSFHIGGGIHLEMHWKPTSLPSDADSYLKELMGGLMEHRQQVSEGRSVYYAPDAFYHGLLLLLHTGKHLISSGIGLRHLCDWAVFTSQFSETEFSGLFREPLCRTGLWNFAVALNCLSARYLSCGEYPAASPFDDTFPERLMADILKSGDLGSKDIYKKYQGVYLRNANTGMVEENTLRNVFRYIFVKAERSYPGTKNRPLLHAAGCVLVCGDYLRRIMLNRRNDFASAQVISNLTQRKELYADLKLFVAESVEPVGEH